LDVKARRNLWDLLIEEKKGRTILLSTHYMEEAEVLSDRIAIMNEGKLKTIGTSFFLKKKFGSGYQLIVVKKNNCRSSNIKSAVQKFAPDVSIASEEQMEVTFTLSEEYLDKFDKIFKHLEDNAEELKIESFGCSISTLEEVFLKVGVDQVQKEQNGHETTVKFSNPFVSTNKVSRTQMFFNQIYAMILKKLHYTKRNLSPYIFLSLVTMGLIFVFLAAPTNLDSNFELKLTSLIVTNLPNSSFVTSYKSLFRENVEIINENIRDFVYGSFLERNLKYEIGVSLDATPTTIWFNSFSDWARQYSYALNYYHRAVLKTVCDDCDIRLKYDIYRNFEEATTTTTDSSNQEEEVFSQFQEILIYILFLFTLTYWPSIHIVMRVKERITKAKLLQFISGANRLLYTIVTYFMDVIILMIILCIVLGIVAAMDRSGFNTANDIKMYLSVFSCYSLNIIAWIYLLALLFKNPLAGESAASYISYACEHT
jgi:ATP-binding cassette, subfamily A (ABC1), member 3